MFTYTGGEKTCVMIRYIYVLKGLEVMSCSHIPEVKKHV